MLNEDFWDTPSWVGSQGAERRRERRICVPTGRATDFEVDLELGPGPAGRLAPLDVSVHGLGFCTGRLTSALGTHINGHPVRFRLASPNAAWLEVRAATPAPGREGLELDISESLEDPPSRAPWRFGRRRRSRRGRRPCWAG
jgi:hypothetical protein